MIVENNKIVIAKEEIDENMSIKYNRSSSTIEIETDKDIDLEILELDMDNIPFYTTKNISISYIMRKLPQQQYSIVTATLQATSCI